MSATVPAGSPAPDAVPRPASPVGARAIRVVFRADRDGRGLLGSDSRIRTIRKVLVTYSEVRHILPDRVRLVPDADEKVVETIARFLLRQQWLVKSATLE